jgi:Tat protein secretion system quality control protein TatD with DNase activity
VSCVYEESSTVVSLIEIVTVYEIATEMAVFHCFTGKGYLASCQIDHSMMLSSLNNIPLTQEMLRLITAIDEFKGAWRALRNIAPDRLT